MTRCFGGCFATETSRHRFFTACPHVLPLSLTFCIVVVESVSWFGHFYWACSCVGPVPRPALCGGGPDGQQQRHGCLVHGLGTCAFHLGGSCKGSLRTLACWTLQWGFSHVLRAYRLDGASWGNGARIMGSAEKYTKKILSSKTDITLSEVICCFSECLGPPFVVTDGARNWGHQSLWLY